MEAAIYFIDVTLALVAMYWAVSNSSRPPGTPTFGLFRYRETYDAAGRKNRRAGPASPPGAARPPGFRR